MHNLDGAQKHDAERKKPGMRGDILYHSCKTLGKISLNGQQQKADQELPQRQGGLALAGNRSRGIF